MNTSKNVEGAYVIDELVTDGTDVFLHTMRFYYYTRAEAQEMFRDYLRSQGWSSY
jgi:isochorismate hydrolase